MATGWEETEAGVRVLCRFPRKSRIHLLTYRQERLWGLVDLSANALLDPARVDDHQSGSAVPVSVVLGLCFLAIMGQGKAFLRTLGRKCPRWSRLRT